VDTTTVLCGLVALAAALPALDAILRLRRLRRGRGAPGRGACPARVLVLVPARAEGARVGDIAADAKREADAAGVAVDVCVILDGPDPEAQARLERDQIAFLSKNPPGPAKGHALAFLAERMGSELDASDFVLVFDADMRLPEGFFRDLAVPVGTEVFQLPVRPAGIPVPGAPRVEALSLAQAAEDDLARDAEGLPVRLRGKAMGFSPRAFRAGPAAATATTAEDSEATLRLLGSGVRVRALEAPVAFDEPVPGARAMSGSRARWLGGHMKLFFTGLGDLLRIAAKSPEGAFVLACDLWLRPRVFVLAALALLAISSDVLMVVFSSSARPVALLAFLLLLSLEAKTALVLEWLSIAALRRRLGYPPEVPPVSSADVVGSLAMWSRAVVRSLLSPGKWHRARPEA
jgi:cellulose synthase/poly-beta-1,6-N-acetylglucosamine synthase-like glycosyltransferase